MLQIYGSGAGNVYRPTSGENLISLSSPSVIYEGQRKQIDALQKWGIMHCVKPLACLNTFIRNKLRSNTYIYMLFVFSPCVLLLLSAQSDLDFVCRLKIRHQS